MTIIASNVPGLEPVLKRICDELQRAEQMHKPINSLHEGYAVITEELDEFWDQVKRKSCDRDSVSVRTELVQVAAMCVARF